MKNNEADHYIFPRMLRRLLLHFLRQIMWGLFSEILHCMVQYLPNNLYKRYIRKKKARRCRHI